MGKKINNRCTSAPVTRSQPQLCVSTTHVHGSGQWTLSVWRTRETLTNSFGGIGRSHKCDGHGLVFNSREAADQYCWDHGYLMEFRRAKTPEQKERAKQSWDIWRKNERNTKLDVD